MTSSGKFAGCEFGCGTDMGCVCGNLSGGALRSYLSVGFPFCGGGRVALMLLMGL